MNKAFTKKQLKAIELLARGDYEHLAEVAKEVGCASRTLYQWRTRSVFMDAVVDRAREILKESLPEIYKKSSSLAKGGDYHHVKILLDHLDKLDEMKNKSNEGTITFTWKNPPQEESDG